MGPNQLGGLSSLFGSLTGQQPQNQSNSNQQPIMGQMGGLNLGGLMSMFGGGFGMGMNMPNNLQANNSGNQSQPMQAASQQVNNLGTRI